MATTSKKYLSLPFFLFYIRGSVQDISLNIYFLPQTFRTHRTMTTSNLQESKRYNLAVDDTGRRSESSLMNISTKKVQKYLN